MIDLHWNCDHQPVGRGHAKPIERSFSFSRIGKRNVRQQADNEKAGRER